RGGGIRLVDDDERLAAGRLARPEAEDFRLGRLVQDDGGEPALRVDVAGGEQEAGGRGDFVLRERVERVVRLVAVGGRKERGDAQNEGEDRGNGSHDCFILVTGHDVGKKIRGI